MALRLKRKGVQSVWWQHHSNAVVLRLISAISTEFSEWGLNWIQTKAGCTLMNLDFYRESKVRDVAASKPRI